jgi:hypothetical protein
VSEKSLQTKASLFFLCPERAELASSGTVGATRTKKMEKFKSGGDSVL